MSAPTVNDSLAADQAEARSVEHVKAPVPARRRTLLAVVAAVAQLSPAQAAMLAARS